MLRVASQVSDNLFQMSLDYLVEPCRREAIRTEAEEQVLFLFTGARVLQALGGE
ncbi:hypothetical protein [Metapseudomonas boanensis]|uniref:TetR family transcriptional regulator n=1 Tax=Metapseudomonas boanensis TaxID=2822138 RepID=A0ABS5XL62_9GAMM|nr:hypothetical protein [Pseudomonas boanensis]MBT8768417.1 hypothetical protein [Pseudomonas boanensis]